MSNEQHYVPDMMGCSDGGCLFNYKAPGTMVTNGGCSCMRELTRSDVGFRAYRTILWLRQNQPTPQADHIAEQMQAVWVPKRDMTTKVQMIKDIREKAGCGLKEAKQAMDAVYDSCSTFEQVVELGVLHALRPKYDYSCDRMEGCVCGGDTQGVRQTCGYYIGVQL